MSDALDKNAVLTHFDGDADLIKEIACIFAQSSQDWLVQLREALARQDADQVRRIAHTLKGSASNFMARPVTEAAFRLESLGRSGDLSAAPDALAALELQVHELRKALDALVRDLRPVS